MTLWKVGEYVHFRVKVAEPSVWCVHFGQIVRVLIDKVQINTGEEIVWADFADVTYEGERFQDRLI